MKKKEVGAITYALKSCLHFEQHVIGWGLKYKTNEPSVRFSSLLNMDRYNINAHRLHLCGLPQAVLVYMFSWSSYSDFLALGLTCRQFTMASSTTNHASSTIDLAMEMNCKRNLLYSQKKQDSNESETQPRKYWKNLFNAIERRYAVGASLRRMSTNHHHSLWIDANTGVVFATGEVDLDDMGATTFVSSPRFKPIHSLIRYRARQVAAGESHSLVLMESGQVFSFGKNTCGQCGVMGQEEVENPTLIQGLAEQVIVSINTNSDHSFAISNTGQVWAFGNNASGQLGLGFGENVVFLPTAVSFLDTQPQPRIVQCSSGERHSLFLSVRGQVYGCGSNGQFQLGQVNATTGNPQIRAALTPIPIHMSYLRCAAVETMAVQVAAFDDISSVVTSQGQLFLFGQSQDQGIWPKPTLLNYLDHVDIKMVAHSLFEILILSMDGNVVTVELGSDSFPGNVLAKPDKSFAEPIGSIATGGGHFFAMSRGSTENLYTWGEVHNLAVVGLGNSDDFVDDGLYVHLERVELVPIDKGEL